VFPVPVAWPDPVPPVPLEAVPLILTDFSSEPYSVSAHAALAGILVLSEDSDRIRSPVPIESDR
jgi:hypothetical protein